MPDQSYLTVEEADELAAAMPAAQVAAYVALTDDDQKLAYLTQASIEIDALWPWQGMKYADVFGSVAGAQAREFPRVPYPRGTGIGRSSTASLQPRDVWDWDAEANDGQGAAVVPSNVLRAVMLHACDLISLRWRSKILSRVGLKSQGVGSLNESYSDAIALGLTARDLVTPVARTMVEKYRLKQGDLL